MPSVWDEPGIGRSTWVPTANGGIGGFRAATPDEIKTQDAERDRRRRASRNSFIKSAILGTAGVVAGGYGLAALTGGLGAGGSSLAGMVPNAAPAAGQVPAGTFAAGAPLTGAASTAPIAAPASSLGGWSTPLFGTAANGSTSLIPGVASTVAGGAGGGGGGGILGTIGGFLGKGNNAIELGKMGVGGLTSYLQNRSTQNALRDTNAATLADNAAQRDFLREQYDREHQDYLDAIAEQKRQWDEEQKEKARQWAAMEPWREAGRGNLTRMSALLDEPRPGRVAYQPTFQYRP